MRIRLEDQELLLLMQEHDLTVRSLQREFDALPQRQALLEIRAKKRTLAQKAEQISVYMADAKAKNVRLHVEDDALLEKEKRIQSEIESVRSDFRSVDARTKELAGLEKRRAALKLDIDASEANLNKVKALKAQADAAMEQLNHSEEIQTQGFVDEGTGLKALMDQHKAQYEQVAAELPSDLRQMYERILARTQGVVLGKLQDSSCSACRASINEGKLLDMKAKGNVGICPHCGRMLFLEED